MPADEEPEIEGQRITRLEVLDPRWCRPMPVAMLERAVEGSQIEGLGRRGKYLLLSLERERTLVMHLRMTGNLVLVEGENKLDPSEGRRLYENERSVSEHRAALASSSTTAVSSGSPIRVASARPS